MKEEKLTVLIADEDKVLTDGKVACKSVILSLKRTKEEFEEITEEEAIERGLLPKQEA